MKIIWLRKLLEGLSNRMESIKHHTIWLRAIVGVMYFLLFTGLLSSSLFVAKLHLEVGEPSPQLITAPHNKDIEDTQKYAQDQDANAKAVQAVYRPDDEYLSLLTKELRKAIVAIQEAAATAGDESVRVTKLQQTQPFTVLAKGILVSLMKTSPDALTAAEQIGGNLILNRARNADTGARTDSDVAPLREETKADINKSELQDDAKVFLKAFVDQKVTRPTLTVDEETTEKLRVAARAVTKKEVISYKANQK
ncbi:MAG TPA: hypothetical protein VMV58_01715, partial [Desulfosporosinus sp.]|nr:hypothetical protein [Desulfosporosinus sp.]